MRLPEVRIDGDGLAHEPDGAVATAGRLRELDAREHLRRRLGDSRRARRRLHRLLLRRGAAPGDRKQKNGPRQGAFHFLPPRGSFVATSCAESPRLGALISGGSAAGADERTSKPISLAGGYRSALSLPIAARIFALH